jgi:hypothetical protein
MRLPSSAHHTGFLAGSTLSPQQAAPTYIHSPTTTYPSPRTLQTQTCAQHSVTTVGNAKHKPHPALTFFSTSYRLPSGQYSVTTAGGARHTPMNSTTLGCRSVAKMPTSCRSARSLASSHEGQSRGVPDAGLSLPAGRSVRIFTATSVWLKLPISTRPAGRCTAKISG